MLCSEANFTWKKEREGGMGEKKKGRKERNNNQAMSNICVALKKFFLATLCSTQDLVPRPGTKPAPPAVEAQS